MILDTKHLIGFGLAIVLALSSVYLIEARVADKAQAKADQAEAKAELLTKQNSDFQASVTAQIAQLEAQNESLAKALSQRQTVEVKLPTNNGGLNATQVASGIQTVTQSPATASGDVIQLPLTTGQQALTALQLVPMLQADKTELTTELANETQALTLEKQAHTSDVTTLNAQIVADKVELKAVKAAARKSKFKWFIAGVVTGFAGRSALKF